MVQVVKRIFLTLAVISIVGLAVAFVFGFLIGDPTERSADVQRLVAWHFLIAIGALVFATLVHAMVLTYFMGTSRWIEETSTAYSLGSGYHDENKKLKYQTIPWMVVSLCLLITTGAFGAAADPASPVQFAGWWGMSGANWHFLVASLTVAINVVVNLYEYLAISQNSAIVDRVLAEVRRIREERGLPV